MTFKSELTNRLDQIEDLILTVTHVGLEEKEGFLQDRWIIILDYNDQVYDSEFRSGVGNRTHPSWIKRKGKGFYNASLGEAKNEKDACKAGWLKPVAPTLADVVGCLLIDSSCASGTFEDYCSDFGIDTDSRKQLDLYLICQKTRSAMIKMFGQELFDELSQLEH